MAKDRVTSEQDTPIKIRDIEGNEASPSSRPRLFLIVASVLAVAMGVFHIYTAYFGMLSFGLRHEFSFRAVHLLFALVLVFLLYPARGSSKTAPGGWLNNVLLGFDLLLMVASVISVGYIVLWFPEVYARAGILTPTEITLGILAIIVTIEATRRTMGPAIPIIAIIALLYAYFGPYMPGVLAHRGFSIQRIVTNTYALWDGIFGSPLAASAQYVFLFVLFAAFLSASGGSEFFMQIALAITGRVRGGPAKAAAIGSSLMGTISGSSVANVVGTGTITIPLMKRTGYSPQLAGAVEAVASSGGQIMPPIMGAAAFVMAELTGTPYSQIAIAAAFPAILYYAALFLMVDLEAVRAGLKGLDPQDIPKLRPVLAQGWHLFAPLIVLVALLAMQYTATYAGFYALVTTFVVSWLKPHTRMTLKRLLQALQDGARNAVGVAVACGALGIIVSSVLMTGLGARLSSLLIDLSGGVLPLLLVLTMVASIIMGMGLPTIACYIILAAMVAPALVRMGLSPLVAHMFIFYFGCMSHITPPVAVAAYAAGAIAGANPMAVGFTAWRLGLTGFLVPYIFVYGPELLLQVGEGGYVSLAIALVTALLGVTLLSQGLSGISFYPPGAQLSVPQRALLIVGAIVLIVPGIWTDLLGVALGLLALGPAAFAYRQKQLGIGLSRS